MTKPLSILLIIFSCCKTFCQIDFKTQIHEDGSWFEVVDIGDVNNDGLNDVIVGNNYYFDSLNDYHLFIYFQNDENRLLDPIKLKFPKVYPGIKVLHISDINNDSLNDIIIGYSDSIGVFTQDKDSGFKGIKTYYSGKGVDGLKVGDLNSDGLNDIAVCHWNSSFINIFYQTQTDTFNIKSYEVPSGGYDEIDVGDVNNDGLDDIVYMHGQGDGTLFVFYQDSLLGLNNTFEMYIHGISNFHTFNGIGLGDINNDNKIDIVGSYGNNTSIVLLTQDSSNTLFGSYEELSAYSNPYQIEISDLNCDSKNEIIVGHKGFSTVTIYEQSENGSYSQYIKHQSYNNGNPYGLAIGDINNDKKPDIVTLEQLGVSFLYNTSSPKEFTIINTLVQNEISIKDTVEIIEVSTDTIVDSTNDCHLQWIYQTKTSYQIAKDSINGDSIIYRMGEICGEIHLDTLSNHFQELTQHLIKIDTNQTLISYDTLIFEYIRTGSFTKIDTNDIWSELTLDTIRLEEISFSNDTSIIKVDTIELKKRTLYTDYNFYYYDIYQGIKCENLFMDSVLSYSENIINDNLISSDTVFLSSHIERFPEFPFSVGLVNPEIKNVIEIYPTESSEIIFIKNLSSDIANVQLKIIDLSGKTIFTQNLPPQIIQSISIKDFENGLYLISLQNDDITIFKKIVKK